MKKIIFYCLYCLFFFWSPVFAGRGGDLVHHLHSVPVQSLSLQNDGWFWNPGLIILSSTAVIFIGLLVAWVVLELASLISDAKCNWETTKEGKSNQG